MRLDSPRCMVKFQGNGSFLQLTSIILQNLRSDSCDLMSLRISLFSLFRKNKRRLMRSPCCLLVYPYVFVHILTF
jgi:hypothetical protein